MTTPVVDRHTDLNPSHRWLLGDNRRTDSVRITEHQKTTRMSQSGTHLFTTDDLSLVDEIDNQETLLHYPLPPSDVNVPSVDTDFTRVQVRHIHLRFFRYATAGPVILVDEYDVVDSPEEDLDPEYQRVVEQLRSGGREVLAEELIEMLQNSREDPEEAGIQLYSLQAMASFLVRNGKFEDPVSGPNPRGIMQIEWHIAGNGLLVMAFVEDGQIHCVVQADATTERSEINKNERLTEREALEAFGYLVPLR